MALEIWKEVVGYEGHYEVSNYGRVKSLGNDRTKKEKILKPGKDDRGYLLVYLYKDGKRFNKKVSRLVAEAFISNPKNKRTVNHINGIKDDNRVENLEWASDREQMFHAYKTGLKVVSEKHRLALAKSAKDRFQIISTWINEKLDLEFIGSVADLVKAFPEQKLNQGNLSGVRLRKFSQHKNWTVKL